MKLVEWTLFARWLLLSPMMESQNRWCGSALLVGAGLF
jgi:hypothetical protein